MLSNFLVYKPEKAVIIAKYHSPDISYEHLCRDAVKCGAIVEVCQQRLRLFMLQVWLNVDPVFGRILWHQISISDNFCVHLTSWLFHQWRRVKEKKAYQLTGDCHHVFDFGKACSVHIQEKKMKINNSGVCLIRSRINIQPLTCLCLEPDLNWCKRLLVGLVEYMQLQDVMAWLSTLGGAYSAMGEHLYNYSERAGQISQHQLLVAMRLGNPVLVAQCKVFAALSLVQRGRLKMASKIIREQYRLAVLNGYARDEKLISSCKAAWFRIQYLKKQQKRKKPAEYSPAKE